MVATIVSSVLFAFFLFMPLLRFVGPGETAEHRLLRENEEEAEREAAKYAGDEEHHFGAKQTTRPWPICPSSKKTKLRKIPTCLPPPLE